MSAPDLKSFKSLAAKFRSTSIVTLRVSTAYSGTLMSLYFNGSDLIGTASFSRSSFQIAEVRMTKYPSGMTATRTNPVNRTKLSSGKNLFNAKPTTTGAIACKIIVYALSGIKSIDGRIPEKIGTVNTLTK